jgi:coenzyme F420-reducing hydrogenase alpha subunit
MHSAVHDVATTIGGPHQMVKNTKSSKVVKKAAKVAKKAAKKAEKSETKVDRSDTPPDSPFSS